MSWVGTAPHTCGLSRPLASRSHSQSSTSCHSLFSLFGTSPRPSLHSTRGSRPDTWSRLLTQRLQSSQLPQPQVHLIYYSLRLANPLAQTPPTGQLLAARLSAPTYKEKEQLKNSIWAEKCNPVLQGRALVSSSAKIRVRPCHL